MLKVASDSASAVIHDAAAAIPGSAELPQVVEIGLLMPAHWASALIELSKIRQTSVAQILRASVAQTLREVGVPV
jgi:hypothetical protein